MLSVLVSFARYHLRNGMCDMRKMSSLSGALQGQFGYSNDESMYIIKRLNEMDPDASKIVGEGNRKKIDAYKNQNGDLNKIEDLLKVHGLGPKSMKRLCDKILSFKSGSKHIDTYKRTRLNLVTPHITDVYASSIMTVGSINIGVNEVTWSKVNCISKTLEVWDLVSFQPYLEINKKLDLLTIISISKEVIKSLPECDIFILEDTSSSYTSGTSQVKQNMTAVISAHIYQNGDRPRLAFLSGRTVGKWSGRLVGSEMVSSQSVISGVVVNLTEDGQLPGVPLSVTTQVSADPQVRAKYISQTGPVKESLANSLFLSLAFIDLVIYKREPLQQLLKNPSP